MIVLYIILALVVLLFMVLLHELGHYIVGRILKFKITEFSVGFGKAIFSKVNKRGEKISLRIFPLGGYCAFYGEDDDKNDPLAFNNQKPYKRILVFLAGVTANFLTAIIFSWILLCTMGYDVKQVVSVSNVPISYDVADSDYYDYVNDLQSGDVILQINGNKVDFAFGSTFATLVSNIQEEAKEFYDENGMPTTNSSLEDFYHATFTIRREGEIIDTQVYLFPSTYTNLDTQESTIYYLAGYNYSSYKYGFFEGLGRSFSVAFGFAWVVLKSLWLLITFQLPISDIGGPVTTIATMAQVTQTNFANLLILIPLLSANLAVFNLLPIPSLDGAHVVFTIIEWIRKKPINRNVEANIHFYGLCVLLAFVVIVDILHFIL